MVFAMRRQVARLIGSALALGLIVSGLHAGTAEAATKLRLSTLAQPGSDGHKAAEAFAERVAAATDGRLEINVYPANQLGDWVEVHEQVMQGAVDLALQPLSTKFEEKLAITWFPYTVQDYDSAREAFTAGGYVFRAVDDMVANGNLKVLGPYAIGMGGAGFVKAVPEPRDPDAKQGMKIRVWPGGTTHMELMKRFGFQVTPIPWAELYTSMQTGVVDGVIGGTPQLAVENFKDILKMWIQYNDHFENWWFIMNRERFDTLSPEDQKAVIEIATEIADQRFDEVEAADEKNLEELRQAGAEIVLLSDQELSKFAAVARQDVWPKIADEIGPEAMGTLKKELGL